jgi:membrane fusion protein, multidrug efflux system
VRTQRMSSFKASESLEPSGLPKHPDGHSGGHLAGAGKRRGRSHRWVWLLLLVIAAGGIWYWRGVRASNSAQNSASAKGGKGKSADFVVPVVVATAQKGDLPVYLNGLGNVAAFNTVTIRSRVDGQILSVAFQEGQIVKQGELLIQIDPRPFQVMLAVAEGQLAKDQAQLHDAKVNLDRFDSLFQQGVIPRQQRDTQQALVEQVEGSIKSDQAQIDNAKLQITYSRITAPITGRIGLRLVDVGNIIHANDTQGLLLITQVQPIAVLSTLPQDQLSQVYTKLRAGVQLPVDAFDRDNLTKIATGKLLTIDNQIDATTGTYKLKSVFSNTDNALFPNQFVNVHLLVDVRKNLTIIPAAALQRGPQGQYVYVVTSDNKTKIQNVTVAQMAGDNAGVSAGLNAGDVVVIDGQDKLQEGSRVNARTPTGGSAAGAGGKGQ